MSKLDFSATLGMCEMECCASEIVELCVEHGSWGRPIGYDDVKEKNGYLQLIAAGWLRRGYHKSVFFVTDDLIYYLKHKLPSYALDLGYDGMSGWMLGEDDDPYLLHPKKPWTSGR